MPLPALADIKDEFLFLDDRFDRIQSLIDLGRQLEPMPEALKSDATLVRGCESKVWAYPLVQDGKLHFLADSNSAITKGIIALVIASVQDRTANEIAKLDVMHEIEPFQVDKYLTSKRTSGVANMIALIRSTSERYLLHPPA